MVRLGFAAFWLLVLGAWGLVAEAASPVGRKVEDFTLPDAKGEAHSLASLSGKKLVVLAMLGTECPIARLYADRLQQIADQFEARGVAVVGIDSNDQDSAEDIARFTEAHKLRFPLVRDPRQKVADRLGVERTSEVYVLDEKRIVRYHGAIDDQYDYELQRPDVTNEYLIAALEDLLGGRAVRKAETKAVGCLITRVSEPKRGSGVTWANQISRIVQDRCVTCHRPGEVAPFSMLDYHEVIGWADMIEEVVRQGRMPPWHADPQVGHFANDRRLTDEQKQLLYQWIKDGTPEGDRKQLPPAPKFIEGWQLPQKPDAEIRMCDEPHAVPAHGVIPYQYFTVDPQFTESHWVKSVELKPSNRAVVHHVLVFVLAPGQEETPSGAEGGFLAAYVPGLPAESFPKGMGKYIPAGSKLVFQAHFTPVGSAQKVDARLGLVFADAKEITHQIVTAAAVQTNLEIPPGAADYEREATSPATPVDVLLLTMMPHMHLRGKSFRYEAIDPSGKAEALLDVPRYDFNWQTGYHLAEPRPLRAGTRIHCVAHYDNSEHNKANPDPSATVRWGEQTWDEMMIGYFDVAVPIRDGRPVQFTPTVSPEERADRVLLRFDGNGDGKLSRDEVPERMRPFFGQIDSDSDGLVTRDELIKAMRRQRRR